MQRTATYLLILAAGLTMTGCTTWVNIPPQGNELAVHSANDLVVREVMVASLAGALQTYPPQGQYVIVLPEGASLETYNDVLTHLPEGAGRVADEQGLLPVYEVGRVAVRGFEADVDVVWSSARGPDEAVTVYLKRDWDGWYVTRKRVWRVPPPEIVPHS
jgi:hypothetical protein